MQEDIENSNDASLELKKFGDQIEEHLSSSF
jgi:hypothetical protein